MIKCEAIKPSKSLQAFLIALAEKSDISLLLCNITGIQADRQREGDFHSAKRASWIQDQALRTLQHSGYLPRPDAGSTVWASSKHCIIYLDDIREHSANLRPLLTSNPPPNETRALRQDLRWDLSTQFSLPQACERRFVDCADIMFTTKSPFVKHR